MRPANHMQYMLDVPAVAVLAIENHRVFLGLQEEAVSETIDYSKQAAPLQISRLARNGKPLRLSLNQN